MRLTTTFAAAAALTACFAAFAQHGGDATADTKALEARRQEILQMANTTVKQLKTSNKEAAALMDHAYGYAVFDTTKGGLLVTGAGGTGAAMRKGGLGMPVFMHVGAAGIGLGAGIENYKLVVLLQDKDVYKRFIDGAWAAGASAQAAAGEKGKGAVARFVNGVAVYHIDDKGVIAQADVTGVKFWPSDRLNPGPA